MAVWGRARHLSVTEATHYTESLRVSGEKTYVSFKSEFQSGGQPQRFPTF